MWKLPQVVFLFPCFNKNHRFCALFSCSNICFQYLAAAECCLQFLFSGAQEWSDKAHAWRVKELVRPVCQTQDHPLIIIIILILCLMLFFVGSILLHPSCIIPSQFIKVFHFFSFFWFWLLTIPLFLTWGINFCGIVIKKDLLLISES